MILKQTLFTLLSVFLALPALAQPQAEQEYTQRTELLGVTSRPLSGPEVSACLAPADQDRIPVIAAGLIIMAGAKAWNVIINGRPSADLASAYASAIPGFQYNWDEAAGWNEVTRKYRFTMENSVQGKAVDIVYEVSFFHGPIPIPGSNPVRNGHYIVNFVIKPEAIDLKWGWKVSLSALMSHPMNIGTSADPVAMLGADLKWQYVKPFTSEPKIGINALAVTGLGSLEEQAFGESLNITPLLPAPGAPEIPKISWD
jgi:hypothetical protein